MWKTYKMSIPPLFPFNWLCRKSSTEFSTSPLSPAKECLRTQWNLLSFFNFVAGTWQKKKRRKKKKTSSIWCWPIVKWWIILYIDSSHCTKEAILTSTPLKTSKQLPPVINNQSKYCIVWGMSRHRWKSSRNRPWRGTGSYKVQICMNELKK